MPQSLTASPSVPNIYFVLDRSGSMKNDGKWPAMRVVVSQLMTTLGSSSMFGVAVFPAPGTDQCQAGSEILPLQLGDSAGNLAGAFVSATSAPPNGGTPTAATLQNLTPELTGFSGPTYVILATDGGADCNPDLSCSLNECTRNIDRADPMCQPFVPPNCCDPTIVGMGAGGGCLDSQATIDAVAQLRTQNVPTYVVGIPGSDPYEQMLDQLAEAGGTARPGATAYYRVDSADTSALEEALAQVAADIMSSCDLTLNQAADPNTLVVREAGRFIPKDPANGWTLAGTTLSLHGLSCQGLLSGPPKSLVITAGCPRSG